MDTLPAAAMWDGFVDFTPDQLSGAASNVPLAVDILSLGRQPSRIRQLQTPDGWSLDTSHINSHVRARGGFQRGSLVVLMPTRSADATVCNAPLEADTVLIIPGGEEIYASMKPGAAYIAAVLPADTWRDIQVTATGASMDRTPDTPRTIRLSGPGLHSVRSRLAVLPTRLHESGVDEVAWRMPATIVEYLGAIAEASVGGELIERQLDRSLRNRLDQAWKADEFIRGHLGETLSVMRLCKELRLSRRQLEYAVRTAFDLSPAEYIQRIRLNESRRRLLISQRTGQTVTEVAMEAGITHLSRFAAYYRNLFGETPSETARRV